MCLQDKRLTTSRQQEPGFWLPSSLGRAALVSTTVSSGKRLDGSSATRQNGGHEKTAAKVAPAWFRRYTVGKERCGMEHGGLKGDKGR